MREYRIDSISLTTASGFRCAISVWGECGRDDNAFLKLLNGQVDLTRASTSQLGVLSRPHTSIFPEYRNGLWLIGSLFPSPGSCKNCLRNPGSVRMKPQRTGHCIPQVHPALHLAMILRDADIDCVRLSAQYFAGIYYTRAQRARRLVLTPRCCPVQHHPGQPGEGLPVRYSVAKRIDPPSQKCRPYRALSSP